MKQSNLPHNNGADSSDVLELAEKDIDFQEKLEGFDKVTLAMWISLSVHNPEGRSWVIDYLTGLEKTLGACGVTQQTSPQELLLEAIKKEIASKQKVSGPEEQLELSDQTAKLHDLADYARFHAECRQPMVALNSLFYLIRDAVICLEHFIEKGADIGVGPLQEAVKKMAGDVGASPAAGADQ